MSSFTVDPDALEQYAARMRDEAEYARAGVTWTDRHILSLPPDGGSGVYSDSVRQVVEGGQGLQRLFSALDAYWTWSADELVETATYYRETETAAAEAADLVYDHTEPVEEEDRW